MKRLLALFVLCGLITVSAMGCGGDSSKTSTKASTPSGGADSTKPK